MWLWWSKPKPNSLLRNYQNSKDMECLSHTLTHPGEHFRLEHLHKFRQDVCALMRASYLIAQHCFNIIKQEFRQPGNTRWWAFYELYVIFCKHWNDVYVCISTAVMDGDVGEVGARINRLVAMMTDCTIRAELRLEIAFVVIVAKPLVQATYNLEGDGPCSLIAYDQLMICKNWFEAHFEELTFPELQEEIELAVEVLSPLKFRNNDVIAREGIRQKVKNAIQPAWDYFRTKIFDDLAKDVAIYKTLRLCNPFSMKRMNFRPNLVEARIGIESLEHFTRDNINQMFNEFPLYLILCEQFTANNPETIEEELRLIIKFWRLNKIQLPYLSLFVRYAYCITPSSASVERVFSLLKNSFGPQQNLTLEDYIKTSLMFQYNNR